MGSSASCRKLDATAGLPDVLTLGEGACGENREFAAIRAENSRAATFSVRRSESYQPGGGFLRMVMVRSWIDR
jgi:hypothetical protein